MFFNPLASWLRGLVAIAIIVTGVLFIREWLDELPRERRVLNGDVVTVQPLASLGDRLDAWDPGANRATAFLVAGTLLLLLSIGGRLVSPRLWRRSVASEVGQRGKGASGKAEVQERPAARIQKFRSRSGHNLHVEEYGPDDGQPLVLVHGLGCDRTVWKEAIEDLSGTFRVLAVDLPGHGRSGGRKDGYTIEALAEDLDQVVRTCGSDGLVLVGHSLGGMVALEWATRHRKEARSLAGLAIVHSTPRNPFHTMEPVPLHRVLQKPLHAPLLRMIPPLDFLVRFMHRLEYWNGTTHWQTALTAFGGSETREQLDRAARLQRDMNPAVVARLSLAAMRFDAREGLAAIEAPTVVVGAEKDPVTRLDASREIARGIASASLVVLPATRHMGFIERRAEFAEAISRFHVLARQGVRAAGRRG